MEHIYKRIWEKADIVRGSVDAWDFKNYILCFLFYRYISEEFVRYISSYPGVPQNLIYENLEDDEEWIEYLREEFIEDKGYFIYPSQLFSNLSKKIDDENLNEKISEIFQKIEESTKNSESKEDFDGLFQLIDLNDTKIGREISQRNKKLREIIRFIESIDFETNDLNVFGEAFDYLIRMYASTAGKSGGEFYTPPEVSELLVKLACYREKNTEIKSIYDPTCGSGSLMLKALKNENTEKNLNFFGQEINLTTYNLCKMNMFLHNIGYDNFDIKYGDTLNKDHFEDRKFHAIVANPPYSAKWEGKDNPRYSEDERFIGAGVLAPKSKADLAFIQHSLYHLDESGSAAIVCFPGILFRKGAEQQIRKWMINENYVDAIIQLPEKLFYGVTIATCIMVLKKSKITKDILFIDASSFYEKSKNRNRLSQENIEKIFEIYKSRQDIENISKVVNNNDTEEYSLSVDSYVIQKDTSEPIDIDALNKSIRERTIEINKLREEIDKLINMF